MLLGERSYESVIKPLGWRSSLLRGSSSRGHPIGHSAPFQDFTAWTQVYARSLHI
jgi:hypothetical protein